MTTTHATQQPLLHGSPDRGNQPNAGGSRATAAPKSALVQAMPWVGLASVAGLGALVFWIFDALPFQDLPAHAGLIAMRHRFADSPFEQRFFVLAPHIGPYSLFRFLGEGLVRFIGPLGAVRAIATLPLLATPAALLFARRRLHGDRSPTIGYVGIALSFGLMTLLGFASYLLGVAVMLVGLTLWLELLVRADPPPSARCRPGRVADLPSRGQPDPTRRLEIVVAAYAPLIFVAHGHAYALFLGLAGVACLAAGNRVRRLVRLRALVPSLLLAGWVAWLERGATTPRGAVALTQGGLTLHFQSAYDKFTLLITPTLMTRSGVDFFLGVVLWLLIAAASVATVRSLRAKVPSSLLPLAPAPVTTDDGRSAAQPGQHLEDARSRLHSRALYAGVVCVALLFIALPHAIGWFGFVDGRLVPLLLLLSAMAIRRPALGAPLRYALDRGAPLIAFAIAGLALFASYRFQAEARGYHEVLDGVPSEARLLNLPLDPNSDVFTAHPFVHYDKLVLAERPIVPSDIWFHQGSALYPTPENPALNLPASYSESDLHGIDWPAYRLADWDYVLIRTRPEAPAPFAPTSLRLAKHAGGWWLYRRALAAEGS